MKVRDYTNPRQVPRYCRAIAPGKHCPLFGVGAVLRGIRGLTLIYVGTRDCVYYAQREALLHRLSSGKEGARVLAAQLGDSDLIFGIRPQMEALLIQEACREDTEMVILVTSCSVEVLSEDLQSVVKTAAGKTGKKIALLPTENFKTFSYFESMNRGLEAATQWLEPRKTQEKTFALLGVRHPGAESSQPVKHLLSRGYTLKSNLPYDISMDQLEALPSVSFTLVMDGTGLSTARQLQKSFGIPYVRFDRKLDLAALREAWELLGNLTGEDLFPWIINQEEEIEILSSQVRSRVEGKTFFYSQVILNPFETCLFLAELGMIPKCIFLGSVVDEDDKARLALAALCDPEMVQNASSAATVALMEKETPDYFIGALDPSAERFAACHVNFKTIPLEAGYAFYQNCLRQLLREGNL